MKIKIHETSKNEKIIDVEFPYYYKHILDLDYGDLVIYGKIEKDKCTTISEKEIGKDFEYEINVEHWDVANNATNLSAYFSDEHKSNETEFLSVKSRLLVVSNNA